MADLLSPGVRVTQADLSQIVPVEGDSAAVFGGDFEKGPVGVHSLITSVQELRENYGMPNTKNFNQYYQVQNFLQYSGAIFVSRAADINGTPTIVEDLLFDEHAYKTNVTATQVEDANLVEVDSVDIKFDSTEAFEIGQVLRFGSTNKEYKVKYVRTVRERIPNPEWRPLTELKVEPINLNLRVDDVADFVVTTDAETYTIETEDPTVVLTNKSLRLITALKPGNTVINFRATKEGSRENIVSINVEVSERPHTQLLVSPETLVIPRGEQRTLLIDTDAETYSIESRNTAIATIEEDKFTINGLRIGTCEVEITATANGSLETTKVITVNVVDKISDDIHGEVIEEIGDLGVTPNGQVALNVGENQVFNIPDENIVMALKNPEDQVLSLDKEGKSVTALTEGTSTIIFKALMDSEGQIIPIPAEIPVVQNNGIIGAPEETEESLETKESEDTEETKVSEEREDTEEVQARQESLESEEREESPEQSEDEAPVRREE